MKFVVVLVSAGLLAFLGAVICIIASVYSRSSAAAPQALSGNRSLSLLEPLPGSVAHAGTLGALHGAESYEGGGGLDIGLEIPSLNELSTGDVTGPGPKQFTLNRLICTPVPISDCKSRGLREQADDPFADEEDWSLRTTAEELRQIIMQQNDQILMDQRTITELTGKVSDCESGLEERSLHERSMGVWAGNRRHMAGDEVSSSVAIQLQTARAVEELEKAILQLKDRIEKLELEIGPAAMNHTEHTVSTLGSVVVGEPGRPVEDLEGELEKKIRLLEKERKNLRKETQSHHQHIDQGINTLQERIAELEQSLTDYSYPQGYKLSFPVRTNHMYGLVRRNIPEMYAFTACLWLKPVENGIGTPFSYAVPEQPNELDTLGGRFDASQALVGELSLFNLWDRVLSPTEVAALAACAESPRLGNIVPWTDRDVDVFGGAVKDPVDPCLQSSHPRQ
ncbi:hypothetical protein cypCar_00025047 [Cyprinus carpio]|nr:hypothetical protein cypCar_00025047 [Cyprinus carpio]